MFSFAAKQLFERQHDQHEKINFFEIDLVDCKLFRLGVLGNRYFGSSHRSLAQGNRQAGLK